MMTSIREYKLRKTELLKLHPREARTGERDSVLELVRKKVRFAERVDAQTSEGDVVTNSRCTSNSSSSISSSCSSSGPTKIAMSVQVDESDQDSSQDRKSRMEQIWNWSGCSWSLSSIVFNHTLTVIF